MARACAKNTDAIFLKLAGPQLVQMYIGDGAKLVRDAFDLAKEKITKEGRKGDHQYTLRTHTHDLLIHSLNASYKHILFHTLLQHILSIPQKRNILITLHSLPPSSPR